MLGLTNAATTDDANDDKQGIVDKLKDFGHTLLENLKFEPSDNDTSTVNETSNDTEPSIFHKPMNMDEARSLLMSFLRLLAQAFMIVS